KIAVDLVNKVQQDKKDGDVDINVKIAPNTTFKVIAINFIETTDDGELAKITPDDRVFIDSVQEATDNILSNYEKEVDGKNNASKAIFETIQLKVQILVNEYKSELEYGDISMKLSSGGDDRRLSFTRTYIKDKKEIIVNLGHIKVDLKKPSKDKEGLQSEHPPEEQTPFNTPNVFDHVGSGKNKVFIHKKTGYVYKKNPAKHGGLNYNVWSSKTAYDNSGQREYSVWADSGKSRGR
ncbi:MAG: Unknown protein, partial [uncultured Sulfurovum sp.]